MPGGLNQHGFEELDGKLYAVAGEAANETNVLYEYDPVADSWATKASLPISVQSPVVRAVNGKLYCIGGLDIDGTTHHDEVYEYTPEPTNAWVLKTGTMPTPREDMGSCVIGGKIYVYGGLKAPGNTVTKVLEIYDPVADSWDATKADMPDFKQLGDFGSTYNGKAYAVGATNTMAGYPSLTPVGAVYEYDPATDGWTAKTAMPSPRCYKECAVIGSKLYVVAGATTSTTDYTDTIYEYDLINDTWSQVTDAPYGARGMGLAVYNGEVYMSGGYISAALPQLYKLSLP